MLRAAMAAAGLLEVYEHARMLLKKLEAGIAANERRQAELLALAERAKAGAGAELPPADSKPKEHAYEKAPSPKQEADQRLLELSAKASAIHQLHKEHLLPLEEAVLEALSRLSDPEALEQLRLRFASETDPRLCLAILRAFAAARFRDGTPLLARKLGAASQAELKSALHQTLTAIAGVDLGDQPAPWLAWWEEAKGQKK